MDTSKFLHEKDFEQFNDTLQSRILMKDYINLEKDIERVIRKKISERMDNAREEWKSACHGGK